MLRGTAATIDQALTQQLEQEYVQLRQATPSYGPDDFSRCLLLSQYCVFSLLFGVIVLGSLTVSRLCLFLFGVGCMRAVSVTLL